MVGKCQTFDLRHQGHRVPLEEFRRDEPGILNSDCTGRYDLLRSPKLADQRPQIIIKQAVVGVSDRVKKRQPRANPSGPIIVYVGETSLR
jgi:hypothetical protein